MKYIKFLLLTLTFLGAAAYVIYAMVDMSEPDPNERCEQVEFIVDKESENNLINVKTIETTLRTKHIYPKGRPMVRIDSKEIESAIAENKFVESVSCYKTSAGKLCIKIKQRTPIIYIIPEGKDGYYVDKTGYIIHAPEYTSNIIIATGQITEKYAKEKLSEFGSFIARDDFWNSQIEQIYITTNQKKQPVIELIPRVGNNIIYLGTIDNYQKKLKRLHTFYTKGLKTVGWNKYKRINLEYDNQIICTKD